MPIRHALVFGIALGVASFGWLWATTNLLSALLAVATILFYVFVYTLLLKRRTWTHLFRVEVLVPQATRSAERPASL